MKLTSLLSSAAPDPLNSPSALYWPSYLRSRRLSSLVGGQGSDIGSPSANDLDPGLEAPPINDLDPGLEAPPANDQGPGPGAPPAND